MDINTIFYFPSSLTFEEYSYKLSQGEISERTIVFADAQKAIYKGGKRYGSMTSQEFHDLVDTLHGNSWISDELTMVRDTMLDSATTMDRFYDTLTNTIHRLDHEIENRDTNIKNKVLQLMHEAEWLQENFPQGVTQWDAGWDADVEAYLSLVGYWTVDANNNRITQWSKLQQQADQILTSVNSLKEQGNLSEALTASIQQLITDRIAQLELGTTYAKITKTNDIQKVIEWMYSGFKSQASSDLTFSEMSSMAKNEFISAISDIRTQVQKVANGDYVALTEIASKVGDTISAMLLQSSSDNALAGMAARLSTVEQDTGTVSQNLASLILGVTGSSSTANLSTVVANKLAGFTTSADINTAKSEIYSAISAKDGSGKFISLASLKTQADQNSSAISAIASSGGNTSGFITKSDLGSAVAELFASSGDGQNSTAKANVVALVKDNKSSLNLSADDVNISGYLNAGNARFKGDVQANVFQTGNDSEYGICVTKSTFNESTANKRKAYFGYDSLQGGVTMWFYLGGLWKKLNLADSAVVNDPDDFREDTFYTISDTSITVLPKNLPSVKLYYNRAKDKYYTSAATTNPASGTYYSISQYNDLFTISNTARSNHSVPYGYYATVREIRSDGSIYQSGLISECGFSINSDYTQTDHIVSTVAYRFIIENGVASHVDPFLIVQAVRDVYYTSDDRILKVIVAPVIVKAAPDTGMPEANNSHFPRIQYHSSNRNRNEYGSTHVITLDGRILEKTGSAVNTNTGEGIQCPTYIASTLSSALGANSSTPRINVGYDYSSASPRYLALTMVYPSTSGYTY